VTYVIHPENYRAFTGTDAQKRKGKVLEDGERLSFDIAFRDAAPKGRPASIDATVKEAIEQQAKLANQKPAAWLANASARDIERIIEGAAKAHVSALSGEGVARGFAFDSIVRRLVDGEHARHDAKFAFLGDAAPAFDRERAEFLARAKFGAQARDTATLTDADVTRSLSTARYSGAAPLVDVEARPNAGTATLDAGAQAKPSGINALRALRYQG
jgi:hypothetical protein